MTDTPAAAVSPTVTVHVPGDKSISHRALMLAALATGRSHLRGLLQSADVHSTAGALRSLGADITPLTDHVEVAGRGLRGLTAPADPLDCGNSGTTTRLLAGIVAGHPFAARFTGDASLSRRPMRRIAEPLEAMGARVTLDDGDHLPMTVHGADLHSIGWSSRSASAQVKSAVLLAALCAQVPVAVTEPLRSRDHTERMLRALGVSVVVDRLTVSTGVARALPPLDLDVPRDPSSAAFLVALAAIRPGTTIRLPGVCLNPTRTHFLDVVRRMGATVEIEEVAERAGEPVGTIVARSGALRAVTVEPGEIPAMIDELPALAVLAARAAGESVVRGAAELRVKESDRIAMVVRNLRAIGAEAHELPDGFRVIGSRAALRGTIRTHGDHRIAMAFAVLGAAPGNEIHVDDPGCVAVSYPRFWDDLARAAS